MLAGAATEFGRADLWLVSPDTARFTQALRVAGSASNAADVPGVGLWAVSSSHTPAEGTLTRVDPVSTQTPSAVKVALYPSDVAVGAGAVWVAIGEPEP